MQLISSVFSMKEETGYPSSRHSIIDSRSEGGGATMVSSDVRVMFCMFVSQTMKQSPRATVELFSMKPLLNVLRPVAVDHIRVPVSVTQGSVTLAPSQTVTTKLLVLG